MEVKTRLVADRTVGQVRSLTERGSQADEVAVVAILDLILTQMMVQHHRL